MHCSLGPCAAGSFRRSLDATPVAASQHDRRLGQEKKRWIRLWSTAESVEAEEVSLLAVLEAVAAVCLTVYLAVREPITLPWLGWEVFGDWTHVVVGAALAPLLLLRTERSTDLGGPACWTTS